MSETKTHANHKLPGWLAPVAVIAALSLGGWFVWSQFNSGPSTGEVIELAPLPEGTQRNRGLGQDIGRALQNLGRNRANTTRPATTRPAQRATTRPAR